MASKYERTKFPSRYIESDVNLLAYVDKAHGNLSGPATKRILEREYEEALRRRTACELLTAAVFTALVRG